MSVTKPNLIDALCWTPPDVEKRLRMDAEHHEWATAQVDSTLRAAGISTFRRHDGSLAWYTDTGSVATLRIEVSE